MPNYSTKSRAFTFRLQSFVGSNTECLSVKPENALTGAASPHKIRATQDPICSQAFAQGDVALGNPDPAFFNINKFDTFNSE